MPVVKTPWKRVRWARGGGTSAASLAMTNRQIADLDDRRSPAGWRTEMCAINSTGANSTCVVPFFHGDLSSYRTLPCGESDRRFSEIAGRAMVRQVLELLALVRLGRDGRLQRETADLAGVAFQRAVIGGDRLQRHHLVPGLRAGGDAVGDRTHPQRVQAIVAASAVGQQGEDRNAC